MARVEQDIILSAENRLTTADYNRYHHAKSQK